MDMKRWGIAIALLALALAFAGAVSADPVASGPQAGQRVPGPFRPLHATGPDAGQRVCLYCKNGANPVAAVFARQLSPALVALVKKIDATTAAHADCRMGSFVVFLNDSREVPGILRQVAAAEHIGNTILCTDAPDGPPSYKIAADADVTVILYTRHTVKANYAFRKGELDDKAIAAVVADIAKILPAE
jgi:hypothetical protein